MSRITIAPTSRARAQTALASCRNELLKVTWLIGTTSVSSSMAASRSSSGAPSPSGLSTTSMRAPWRRCPSHTYMTVGKFWSV